MTRSPVEAAPARAGRTRATALVAPSRQPWLLGRQPAPSRLGGAPRPAAEAILELQRTVGNRAVQRQLLQRNDKAEKAEGALGESLWHDSPDGVAVAFYDDFESAKNRAQVWAKGHQAIGIRRAPRVAGDLIIGVPIAEQHELGATLLAINKVLTAALTRVAPRHGNPGPDAVAAMPAARVRLLAIFSHGTEDWCGLGGGLTTGNAKAKVKQIAPVLTEDVAVLMFACNTARGPDEKESWQQGTMKGGGTKSLSATVRDELVEQGKKKASVWGRTTTGYAVRNPAIRVFFADPARQGGKGAAGIAFADAFVFTAPVRAAAEQELVAEVDRLGRAIDPQSAAARRALTKALDLTMFFSQANAAKTITIKDEAGQERYLAEWAAIDPARVAALFLEHWQGHWAANKTKVAKGLIKQLKLKPKAPATP